MAVKGWRRLRWTTNCKVEKFRINFSRCVNHELVAPLKISLLYTIFAQTSEDTEKFAPVKMYLQCSLNRVRMTVRTREQLMLLALD